MLSLKGIHFVVTRFGPRKLRSRAFDDKYRRGDWCFDSDSDVELGETVRRYLRQGDLLMLGCGRAHVMDGLEASGLTSALGIDLSEEAIRSANRYSSARVAFQVGDMEAFDCPRPYDEILFSESLYYVRASRQIDFLTRLGSRLKPDGVFVATFAEALRFRTMMDRIRMRFRVVEDRPFRNSTRHLLVFQPRCGFSARDEDRQNDTR